VRVEVRSLDTLREALPYLPLRVAAPMARLVHLLGQMQHTHQTMTSQPIDRALYDQTYAAWYEARKRVLERTTWLREYGHALVAALPPTTSAAKDLAALLRRPMHATDQAGRSLAHLVTIQRTIDASVARCEQLL